MKMLLSLATAGSVLALFSPTLSGMAGPGRNQFDSLSDGPKWHKTFMHNRCNSTSTLICPIAYIPCPPPATSEAMDMDDKTDDSKGWNSMTTHPDTEPTPPLLDDTSLTILDLQQFDLINPLNQAVGQFLVVSAALINQPRGYSIDGQIQIKNQASFSFSLFLRAASTKKVGECSLFYSDQAKQQLHLAQTSLPNGQIFTIELNKDGELFLQWWQDSASFSFSPCTAEELRQNDLSVTAACIIMIMTELYAKLLTFD